MSAQSTLISNFQDVALLPLADQAGRSTKAAPPFSLRLSREERNRLEQEAGELPLGAYIRERLFGDDSSTRRTRLRRPGFDHSVLAKVLGQLGDSRLASNVNQLAKAANMGTLPVDAETEKALQDACEAIARMRADLVRAMGLRA